MSQQEIARENSGSVAPLPHTRREMACDFFVAISLANLCLVSAWFPTLYDAYKSYFNKLPVTSGMLLALMAELVCFSLMAWCGMRALRCFQGRWLHLVLHLGFLGLLLLPLDFVRLSLLGVTDYQVVVFLKRPATRGGLLLMAGVVIWQHRLVARSFGILVGILFPLALSTFTRTFLLLLGVQHLALQPGQVALAQLLPTHPGQPRVLWLLFDETDQRLAFDQRPAKVKLPELDRLRCESLCATNAFSPGDSTLVSIPGLISGRRFSSVAVKDLGDLEVTLADNGAISSWSQQPSVFAGARRLGVNSAVVGWYHPYDRLFGTFVSFCVWHPLPLFEPERAATLSATVANQLNCLTGTMRLRRRYVEICGAILPAALEAVTNSDYGLVFLHLPPPHKPGIYLPQQDRYTAAGMRKVDGYFNNLVLADHWLGTLRRAMESTGQWDRSWLILSSDHSWRESAVYDGRRDLRVPFVIKAPGRNRVFSYSPQVQTVITHDLILAILRGEISDQMQTVAWLDARRSFKQGALDHSGPQSVSASPSTLASARQQASCGSR